MLVFATVLYLIIAFIEIFTFIKKKHIKELILYSFIMVTASVLCLMLGFGVRIASPMDWISKIVLSISGQ